MQRELVRWRRCLCSHLGKRARAEMRRRLGDRCLNCLDLLSEVLTKRVEFLPPVVQGQLDEVISQAPHRFEEFLDLVGLDLFRITAEFLQQLRGAPIYVLDAFSIRWQIFRCRAGRP